MARLLVNVDVTDLDAATRFYTGAFGLTVGRRFGAFGVELLGAEAPLYLLVKAPGTAPFAGAAAVRQYQRHWTPVHLDFAVEDLDAAVARALAAGACHDGAGTIAEAAWGRMAVMSDPFGHGFCLLQFTDAGYDAIADA